MNKQRLSSHSPGKLLVICGPTSSGKTSLAMSLAKKFNGELISADSRQVYKGMDIGTGKDLPIGAKIKYPWFEKYGYYEIDGVKIWGYDIADPKQDFSVSQYLKFAKFKISDIQKKGRVPILVGGTGLYIKGVVDGIATVDVPRNLHLRKNLEVRKVDELYEMLSQIDSIKAASLNSSDRKNPRRLMRAIEVAQWELDHGKSLSKNLNSENPNICLMVGLFAPQDLIDRKIKSRIYLRIKLGVKDEIKRLLKSGLKWESQAMSSLGYREWRDFFEGGVDEDNVISQWEIDEKKYAKRQITWFKKDKRVVWFDVASLSYPENVEKLVEKWYSQS